VPPQKFERFVILDEKLWDIMGYYGRQWNDPAPTPSLRAPAHCTVETSLTALKLKDLLPGGVFPGPGKFARIPPLPTSVAFSLPRSE
jgi:hypothetical protein